MALGFSQGQLFKVRILTVQTAPKARKWVAIPGQENDMIGEIAGIIAAVTFAVLVLVLAVPLWKLGGVFSQLEQSIKAIGDETVVAVKQGQTSLDQVNSQLERVDSMTSAANRSVEDLSALTTLFTATLGRPLIKVAAFSYAVRKAMGIDRKNAK
ncbi:hypothetical protein HMPREF0574_0181 [Mobiluncus curtisii subsp. curtisii ATCC 35241]|nr:hypothetical protein HMPREF0574_0181 [Mobiluncus curtisii subsp. curtisii ATCC 35241]QQT13292.1 DUF948 domain-containing protein [Mobiluncus curtisii]